MSAPKRLPAPALLLPFLSLLAGCGEKAPPATADVPGGAPVVEWRESQSDRSALEERVVHRIPLPDDPEDWHLDSPRAFRKQVAFKGETERNETLVLQREDGGDEMRWDLGVPGEYLPDAFNIVRVHLATEAGCHVGARLYRNGERVFASRRTSWAASNVAGTTVDVEMPEVRFQPRPMEHLHLVLRSKGTLGIRAIELVHRPLPLWLPDPAGDAELVHLGPLAREAVGLWSGAPLEAEVELAQPASLTFSLGVPATLEHPSGDSMKITFVASGSEGGEVRRRFELPERGDAPNQWRFHSVELDDLQGERASVRLELETPDDREGVYAVAETRLVQRATHPRTVIFVTSDTHRYDHVGAAGRGIEIATPTVDSLAERGVFFENCYASSNVTNPSHVAIMTATHPRDTAILDNTSPLIGEADTLAEHYRDAGFKTWAVLSAIHLGDRESGLGQGFDRVSIPNDGTYEAKEAVDTLLDWMPEAQGAPLFVWLHLFDAHLPYGPPAPFDRKYYRGDDPFDPALPEGAIPVPDLPPSLRGLRDPDYPNAQYRAEVDYLDSQLARVMSADRARDAIVAVTADHGENLGHHGIYYDHGNLYPDSIHVPLVIAWPNGPAGLRVEEPVDQLDLGRTLLALSRVEAGGFPGASLLPLLEDEEYEHEPRPRFALGAHALSSSVNYGRWHLILHLREHAPGNMTKAHELHEAELYDVLADPLCENNVVDEHVEDARRMRRLLLDWLESASDAGWASEGRKDPGTLQRLRDLGYTTSDGSDIQLLDPNCPCAWCARFDE